MRNVLPVIVIQVIFVFKNFLDFFVFLDFFSLQKLNNYLSLKYSTLHISKFYGIFHKFKCVLQRRNRKLMGDVMIPLGKA